MSSHLNVGPVSAVDVGEDANADEPVLLVVEAEHLEAHSLQLVAQREQ